MRMRVSDHVGRRCLALRRSLLNVQNDISTSSKLDTQKHQNLSPNAVYATCHMHVAPCCIAQRAAEAALQARFLGRLGALLGLGYLDIKHRTVAKPPWPKLTCTYYLYLSTHLYPSSGSPYGCCKGRAWNTNTSMIKIC